MNTSNFVQTGGLRVKAERLQEMQTAYSLFNALGFIAGNLAIISGCTPAGGNTTDGVVFIDGEVLEFRGGFTTDDIIIVEESEPKEFQDGSVKNIHTIRYATFGTADTSWPWADFKSIYPTKDITAAFATLNTRITRLEKYAAPFAVANGSMVFFRKPADQIPDGWQEVVDWRGRMPVGWNPDDATFANLGAASGSKTAALTAANNGPHTHSIDGSIYKRKVGAAEKVKYGSDVPIVTVSQDNVSNTSSSGTGQPFSILNPHRIVMFIEPIPE